MAVKFLANTALAAIFVSKNAIYTYAQAVNGQLVEITGQIAATTDSDLANYSVTGSRTFISPTNPTKKDTQPAKRFTPLAAAPKGDRRYLFYVNKADYLCDVYEEGGSWSAGKLLDKKWKCAAYSKLAAVKITNADGADIICLYYQNADDSGNIQTVNVSGDDCWAVGNPRLCDPPLLGTALAAVLPQPGIQSSSDSEYPVVFFQQSTLVLSSSQDDTTPDYTPYVIADKEKALSGHAYIAAVEDGTDVWCFYTSNDNYIRKIGVDSNASWKQPTRIGSDKTPIPGSPLAAVLSAESDKPENIALFYLLCDATGQWTNIYASTLTRVLTTDADSWSTSPGVCLT